MVNDEGSIVLEQGRHHPPSAGSAISLPDGWTSVRDRGIPARFVSSLAATEESRVGFLWGARALGLDTERKPIHPQQLLVADALNAVDEHGRPIHPMMGVLLPRRSAKTTTIIANALGRCHSRPGWLVGFTLATTGQKGRDRFRTDIVAPLEVQYPDPATRPFKIRRATGSEGITFDNGSRLVVLTPSSEAFRSEAFDEVIVDEAGEASPERSEDLLAGALATMDTRPDAQFIVAGTAPEYRAGNLLWETLEDGRHGRRRTGIVDYSAPDILTADDLADWDVIEPIVRAHHPGIDTLTTIEVIRDRWDRLKPLSFAREYLSIAGTAGAVPGILDAEKWAAGAKPGKLPNLPQRFALAVAVHPDLISACIVAAWRRGGKAHIAVLEHERGTNWLADAAVKISRKYKVPIVHDNQGAVLVEVETMLRKRPKPRTVPQTMRDVQTSAALLVGDLERGALAHFDQEPLNNAARLALKRRIGASGWGFGRGNPEDDVICIEAASLALRSYDSTPARQRVEIMVA